MTNVETRQVDRDSLLLLAQVKVDGGEAEYRVKVRNLSAGGMMAEGHVPVVRGSLIAIFLRNLGWVDGSVAWRQDDRFGIAFVHEIDPRLPRAPAPASGPDMIVPRFARQLPVEAASPARLRKI